MFAISKYVQDKHKIPSGRRPGPAQARLKPGAARSRAGPCAAPSLGRAWAGPAVAWYFVCILNIFDISWIYLVLGYMFGILLICFVPKCSIDLYQKTLIFFNLFWSVAWGGLNGYFKMRRGPTECGIETSPLLVCQQQPHKFRSSSELKALVTDRLSS